MHFMLASGWTQRTKRSCSHRGSSPTNRPIPTSGLWSTTAKSAGGTRRWAGLVLRKLFLGFACESLMLASRNSFSGRAFCLRCRDHDGVFVSTALHLDTDQCVDLTWRSLYKCTMTFQGDHYGCGRWYDSRRRKSRAWHRALVLPVARDEEREEELRKGFGQDGKPLLQATLRRCVRCYRGGECPLRSAGNRAPKRARRTPYIHADVHKFNCFALNPWVYASQT